MNRQTEGFSSFAKLPRVREFQGQTDRTDRALRDGLSLGDFALSELWGLGRGDPGVPLRFTPGYAISPLRGCGGLRLRE